MVNKLLLGIGIVLIAGLTGAYFITNNSQSNEEKISSIRIGSTAPGHLKFILFEQKGWMDKEFAKDGIKVEYYPFTGGGSEVATALASGSIDFAYTGSNPALRTAAVGANIKLIALSGFNPLTTVSIIVKNESGIKSVKDLKGKKVAYLKGTVRHSSLAKALKTEGLSTNDIESLNLNFDAAGPALIRGDIDAVVESDSIVFPLVSMGAARVIISGRDRPDWATPNVIDANGDFAKKHPNIVKRFLKIDLKTKQWVEENPDETIKIFADATKQKEKAVRDLYPQNTFYSDPRITDNAIQSLKNEEEFMKENNLLEGKIDFDSWVDKSFLDSALRELNIK